MKRLRQAPDWRRSTIGLLVLISLVPFAFGAGCELPTTADAGSVEAAYYTWIQARRSHDADTLWETLEPTAQVEFEAWFKAEQQARTTITTHYTEAHIKEALAALNLGSRAQLRDAKSLFVEVLRGAPVQELGAMATMGARARGVEITGEQATLTTWAGDTWVFAQADGGWRATLSAAEMERLRNARQRAEANLATVQLNVKRMSGIK